MIEWLNENLRETASYERSALKTNNSLPRLYRNCNMYPRAKLLFVNNKTLVTISLAILVVL